MALGIDPAEPDVMTRPPRPPEQNILTPDAFAIIGLHGIDMCLLALASYFIALYPQGYKVPTTAYSAPADAEYAKRQLNHAQTAAWATLTAIQLFHGVLARSKLLSVFQVGVVRNKWMLGAIAISFTLLVAGVSFRPISSNLF
jgi:P-type Ca2+ transporter type 2C